MKSNGFKRLGSYLKKYKLALFFVFLFAVVSTLFSVAAPTVMGKITTALYDGATTGEFDWTLIRLLLVGLVMLHLIAQLFAFLQHFGMSKVTAKVMQSLREDIDRKMHRTKLNYYDTRTNGEILSVITNDVDSVNNAISNNLTQIVTQVITAVGILLMMLRIHPWLALIAVVMVPIALLSAKGVMSSSAKHYGKQQELLGELNGYIEEMYHTQSVVQAFNYQDRANRGFDELNEALQKSAQSAETASGTIGPLTSLVNNAGYVLIAILGCMNVLSGRMLVGDVQAVLQYTKQFSQPFTSIAGMAGSLGAASAAIKRIFDLLDAEEEIADPEQGKLPTGPAGAVEFKHVAFGYTPDKKLMNDVNISVKPGQKVAIVGPTGAGKTTLINLLMRFYEIDGGEITVGGVNTRDMTRNELRKHFGMVLQDTWLFEGTIRDNLAYSHDELTDEEILSAARSASADSFIRTLPGGYDMVLPRARRTSLRASVSC